jgi:aminobenzoyl-glutamate utilization protein B
MYQFAKTLKEHVLSSGMSWSMNEAILTLGQATADNLPARRADIMYMSRVPTIAMGERVVRALDHFAEAAAGLAHCSWKRHWICKSRPGLANHVLARLTYGNLALAGPPVWEGKSLGSARRMQGALGYEPMDSPYLDELGALIEPVEAERRIRQLLPPGQTHFTSDDYADYCWQTPTVRLYIGRPAIKVPEGGAPVPDWAMNALGGMPECIDPMVRTAARVIAGTILDLLSDPRHLAAARAEFVERTGGGINGSRWIPPLCDYAPPVDFRWPEYVTTPRGRREWVIPARAGDML